MSDLGERLSEEEVGGILFINTVFKLYLSFQLEDMMRWADKDGD